MSKEINYEELYKSTVKAVEAITNKCNALEALNNILNEEKKQWMEQKIKQDMIIERQLGNSDGAVGQLQEEIRSIKKQLCEECYKKVR